MVKKLLIAGAFVLAISLSALVGNYMSQRESLEVQKQKSLTMISFSIDKIEDLKSAYDDDTMKALISNVYAAAALAPEEALSSALHDLWNALIFDGENLVGKENDLIQALQSTDPDTIERVVNSIRKIA